MGPVSDRLAALIRTAWPTLVGYAAAWAFATFTPTIQWLADAGITITEAQLVAWTGWIAGVLVYAFARWLERRPGEGRWAGAARFAGRWLLSVGIPTGRPVYARAGEVVNVHDLTSGTTRRPHP
jgi:hypothetical protein